MTKLGRGFAALAAAVVVVLVGGGLAVGLAYANPAPSRVLSDARHFVAGARSVQYTTTLTADLPVSANGAQVIRHSSVRGAGRFGVGTDYTSTAGSSSTEVRTLAGQTGVLIRTGPSAASLGNAVWHAVPNLAQLDTAIAQAVARASGVPYNQDAAAAVILSDELSNADTIKRVFALAVSPKRDGDHARDVIATVDGAQAFPEVVGLVGPVVVKIHVNADRHPTAMTVTAKEASSAVTAVFTFTDWNGAVDVPAPAAADIASP